MKWVGLDKAATGASVVGVEFDDLDTELVGAYTKAGLDCRLRTALARDAIE